MTAIVESEHKLLLKLLLKELKELDTYNVSIETDNGCSYLTSERNVDGMWVNIYEIESIIERYNGWLEMEDSPISDEEMVKMFGENWKD